MNWWRWWVAALATNCTHRARLFVAFLAANLLTVLLPVASAERLAWRGIAPWTEQLDSNIEGTLANAYAGIIWGIVAVLGLA